MEDYPRTLADLEDRFTTEQACRDYLAALRWPAGFHCPLCQHDAYWAVGKLLECRRCGHQTSVTAGTIFQDTRKPLRQWFRAAWYVTSQKNGASALGMQRILGLGAYLTAWSWLHKLRRAMVRPDRDRLKGEIEVDEAYLGGMEEGVRGRQTFKKTLIVVAAERDGTRIGRIRMQRAPDASAASLHAFIHAHIQPGSTVYADAWQGYRGLEGYIHKIVMLRGQGELAGQLLPRVHRVISLLKRWVLGTHQGAVSPAHLDYYLDEFTFRFNRRASHYRGKLFYRLLQQAVATDPVPYKQLNQHVRHGPEHPKHNL